MSLFKFFTRPGDTPINTQSQLHRYLPVESGPRGLTVTLSFLSVEVSRESLRETEYNGDTSVITDTDSAE